MTHTIAPGATEPPALDIRSIRESLRLTGPAFAALLNERIPGLRCTKQTVSRWELGVSRPGPAVALVIRSLAKESQA